MWVPSPLAVTPYPTVGAPLVGALPRVNHVDIHLVGAPLVGALRGLLWRPKLDAIAPGCSMVDIATVKKYDHAHTKGQKIIWYTLAHMLVTVNNRTDILFPYIVVPNTPGRGDPRCHRETV